MSERLVLPPSPRTKRATNVTAPNAMSSSRTQLKGVLIVPFSGSNSTWPWPSASATFCARLRKNAYAAPSIAPNTDHGGRHGAERRLGESRKRLFAVCREAKFLERHPRDVQHGRPAELLLAVDVIDVPVGPVGDALVRDGQHLVARAIEQARRPDTL